MSDSQRQFQINKPPIRKLGKTDLEKHEDLWNRDGDTNAKCVAQTENNTDNHGKINALNPFHRPNLEQMNFEVTRRSHLSLGGGLGAGCTGETTL